MRKYFLFTLCAILSFTLLAGCSPHFRDQYGRALTKPYGDEKVIIKPPFYQQYNGYVSIAIDGGDPFEIAYGDSVKASMISKKYFHYELWWAEWIGGGDSVLRHGPKHSVVGLYTGHPIIIDEFLLRGWIKLEVVIQNTGSQTKTFAPTQGGHFTLKPWEEKTLFVVAGNFDLTWPNNGHTVRGRRYLTAGHKVPWNDRAVDAVIQIHDFVLSMDQKRILRNGGYLKL